MLQELTLEEKQLLSINKLITDIACDYDNQWIKRKRSIDSKFLISFIFQIILDTNKGYSISLLRLWEHYSNKDIQTPQQKIFAPSSVCEARQKLSEQIFIDLNKKLISEFNYQKQKVANQLAHRVFAVDGSRVNLPKELKELGYKTCNKNSYYPQGLMSCIYNIDTQIVYDFCLSKNLNERLCVPNHLSVLQKGDIVIFDRGYFSYLLLYQCMKKDIVPVFRVSIHLGNKALLDFVSSAETDSVIEYVPSSTVKKQIEKQGLNIECKPIMLRLVKHEIDDKLYLYATTLIDSKYSRKIFAELYAKRWEIEELYKISKCLVDVEAFHSKTERGVKQETYAHFVLINLARLFELAAKAKYDKNSGNTKFNFKNCLNVIEQSIQTIIYKSELFCTRIILKATYQISQIKQKIRPMRKYLRISHKPFNRWVLNRSPFRT